MKCLYEVYRQHSSFVHQTFNAQFRNRVRIYGLLVSVNESLFPSKANNLVFFYNTFMLPVVLYGCETWSLTLWEERKLRVFENMVLRRIFGHRRDKVMGNGGDCVTRS